MGEKCIEYAGEGTATYVAVHRRMTEGSGEGKVIAVTAESLPG